MTQAAQKIVLSPSRDIPFNKLVLSQSNVRRIKAGVSIEDLAEDIARRTLLQSLNVRALLDAEGRETGMFEVPAGGRRYRALELLVKQKRLARTAPVRAWCATAAMSRPRRIRWPRTASASRCIPSTSSWPSRPCASRARATRRSRPASSSRRPSSVSA
ncbi:ParB/Srx family N-terminal domain-containing protein [Brevundimonas diminuta]|uniref:ParB/Srx family N-terminal domain-containing protein n=1 Tax=Brevundimonas diminuta TaxID=293 RepID=UPI001CC2D50A|nr:ParB/Srx family N-terminal domain-containing protein [Brevundimonas diminuta]